MTPHEGPGTFFGGRFSPDGRSIYLASNKERDLLAFARVKLDPNGQPGPLEVLAARDNAELSTFEINEQGTIAALVWNVAGLSELSFLDLKSGGETKGPAAPAEIVSVLPSQKMAGAWRWCCQAQQRLPIYGYWTSAQSSSPR